MRHADKVVTVGSTAGIEAVFWGTPSVLIGPSFYQELGATYCPTSHDDVMRMIYADIEPKDNTPALMFAYYLATFGIPFKHFEPEGLLNGCFKGVSLAKLRKSKWRIWLSDRRPVTRPKLSPLASDVGSQDPATSAGQKKAA